MHWTVPLLATFPIRDASSAAYTAPPNSFVVLVGRTQVVSLSAAGASAQHIAAPRIRQG